MFCILAQAHQRLLYMSEFVLGLALTTMSWIAVAVVDDDDSSDDEPSWQMIEEYVDPKKLPRKLTSTNEWVNGMHNLEVNQVFVASFQTLETNSQLLLAPYVGIVVHQRA